MNSSPVSSFRVAYRPRHPSIPGKSHHPKGRRVHLSAANIMPVGGSRYYELPRFLTQQHLILGPSKLHQPPLLRSGFLALMYNLPTGSPCSRFEDKPFCRVGIYTSSSTPIHSFIILITQSGQFVFPNFTIERPMSVDEYSVEAPLTALFRTYGIGYGIWQEVVSCLIQSCSTWHQVWNTYHSIVVQNTIISSTFYCTISTLY